MCHDLLQHVIAGADAAGMIKALANARGAGLTLMRGLLADILSARSRAFVWRLKSDHQDTDEGKLFSMLSGLNACWMRSTARARLPFYY